jgi:hypothetical protein
MTISDFDLYKLPEVQPGADDPGSELPRFRGDDSDLPNQACWALQNLLARRYIHKDSHPDLWAWVLKYRRQLSSRLAELDLLLRIHEDFEVAYAEQAQTDVKHARARRLLRRESIGTYASILALYLARIFNSNRAEHLISGEDIHEMFTAIPRTKDCDESAVRDRTEDAITKLVKIGVLLPSSGDVSSYAISSVLGAIMSGQLIEELELEYQRLFSGSPDEKAAPAESVETTTENLDDIELGENDDE